MFETMIVVGALAAIVTERDVAGREAGGAWSTVAEAPLGHCVPMVPGALEIDGRSILTMEASLRRQLVNRPAAPNCAVA
jgi:hypothetical protein